MAVTQRKLAGKASEPLLRSPSQGESPSWQLVWKSGLDHYLHASRSGARVSALTPPIPGQLYGRYSVRFRSDSIPGYKIAWLLWPTSENWVQGEVDFATRRD
jgi:hypothetical protein